MLRIHPRWFFVLLFGAFISSKIFSSLAFAGAVVTQKERMQGQAEQAQVEAVKQAVAQQQQAEVQAYQQAVAQQQAAQIEAVRQEILKQAIQTRIQAQMAQYIQQVQIQGAQQAALKQAVEEELARRLAAQVKQGAVAQVQEQMIAQAMAAGLQRLGMQAMKTQAEIQAIIQQRESMQAAKQAAAQRAAQEREALNAVLVTKALARPPMEFPKDIVDIVQVWNKLDLNSKAWALMMDEEAKARTVNEYMERFRKEGIKIQKPPLHYVRMIDDMASQDKSTLGQPFPVVLQMLAIMEYDFDFGGDRDILARRALGEQGYAVNRKRLGK